MDTVAPTVVHPTAATPMLYNCYAAPFVFLVTGLLLDFRKWLATVGTHEVTSHLSLLFVENGVPLTHDYITALSNYNLRTETNVLREWAHQQVKNLVTDLLFDKPSDTSSRVASFIR